MSFRRTPAAGLIRRFVQYQRFLGQVRLADLGGGPIVGAFMAFGPGALGGWSPGAGAAVLLRGARGA